MSDRGAVIPSRRLTAEDCRTIDTAFLMHHGLLDPHQPAQMVWEWNTDHGRQTVRAVWDPERCLIELKTEGEPPRIVRVAYQELGSGRRVHLVCPVRRKRCKALFLNDDILASLKAHGLRYLSEVRSAVEKRALHERGLVDAPYTPFYPDVVKGGQPFVIKLPEKARHQGRHDRFSTHQALRGKYLPDKTLRKLLERRVAELSPELKRAARQAELLPMWPKEKFSTNVYEAQPRLETGGLMAAGLLFDGHATTAFAAWNCQRPPVPFSALFVDCTDPTFPYVAVLTGWDGKLVSQGLRLLPLDAANGRWRFVCPVTSKAVYTLAFRGGRWASKEAQRLKNASQFSERFIRHAEIGARNDRLKPEGAPA